MGNEVHFNDKGEMYIRKSMLENFSFCPVQFQKTWIERIEKPPNQAMLMGTRFHEFAHRFFDFCSVLVPERWEELVPDGFSILERERAEWFVGKERDRLWCLQDKGLEELWWPILREHHMVDDELLIESTVDRVDWISREDQTVAVVEYKTGSSINEKSIEQQLAFYAMLWEALRHAGHVTTMRLINPTLQVYQDYPLNRLMLKSVMKKIIKLRQTIEEGLYFPKCSDGRFASCRMCSLEEAEMIQAEARLIRFVDAVSDEIFNFDDVTEEI